MVERVKGVKVRGGVVVEVMNKVWCEVEGGGRGWVVVLFLGDCVNGIY